MSVATNATLAQVLAESSALIEMVTVNRSRRYRVGDKLFASVTSALRVLDKPALVRWSGAVQRDHDVEAFISLVQDMSGILPKGEGLRKIALDRIGHKLACYIKRDTAGDIGTQMHALIEYELKRRLGYHGLEKPVLPNNAEGEAALWAYLHFEDWEKSVGLVPVAMECKVSSAYAYAGRFDLLSYVEDALSILDWKTGKDIYVEAHLQNAAYRHATNETLARLNRPERVTKGHLVLLPKIVESDTSWKVVAIGDDTNALNAFLAALSVWYALEDMKKGAR